MPELEYIGQLSARVGGKPMTLATIFYREMDLLGIPKTLKIGGFNWAVIEDKNLMNDRDRLGEMAPRTQEIVIEKDSSDQQKEETMLHEIIEAINWLYGIKLEHHQIELLGVSLHQVLKDNDLQI